MNPSHTLSVSIARKPPDIARFVADPRNLPQWAGAFCKSVRPDGERWIVQTDEGEFGLRFMAAVEHGIVDHVVEIAEDVQVHVPMRVVPNGEGSEVLFTLFRLPAMTEFRWQRDLDMVNADLQRLKAVMESGSEQAANAPRA